MTKQFRIKSQLFNVVCHDLAILKQKNVIYKLNIGNKVYVGKTSRMLLQRLKEHVGGVIRNNDVVEVRILEKCNTKNELVKKEFLWIRCIANKILQANGIREEDIYDPLSCLEVKRYMLNKAY